MDATGPSLAEQLRELEALHACGTLTPTEFVRAKARLLTGAANAGTAATGRTVADLLTGRRFYDRAAIMGASFLGSPLAGAWVAGNNWRALGRPKAERFTWVVAVLLVTAQFAIALAFQRYAERERFRDFDLRVAAWPLNVILSLLFGAVVFRRQEPLLKALPAGDAARHSGWRAVGVGLVFMAVTLTVAAALEGLL